MLQIYPISFVNKFNFENYINRWKNIGLHTIYASNIFKVQILLWWATKKGLSPRNKYDPTYLPTHSYLPTYAYLPTKWFRSDVTWWSLTIAYVIIENVSLMIYLLIGS